MLPKASISAVVSPWIASLGFDDGDFKIEGPELGKRWIFRFSGFPVVASKSVGRCLRGLRRQDGSYVDLVATGVDDTTCPLSVSGDKNPRQIATEISSRRLLKVLKAKCPELRLFLDKVAGLITSSWKDLVKVAHKPSNEETGLLWCMKTAQDLAVDTARITRIFREAVPRREPTVWEEL